jgi:hemolysin III
MPAIYEDLGLAAVVLILAGGLSYTVGAIIYTMKRPWPFPRIFSYHEIFHVLVILGSALHFAAIYSISLPHLGS